MTLRHGLELLCSQPWLKYGHAVLIAACLLALVAVLSMIALVWAVILR